MTAITLDVNGEHHELDVEPRLLLADALRDELGLTGTKIGCSMGACGACTVLLDGAPIRSCLTLAVQASGHQIQTVESLATDGEMSVLQKALQAHHGLQCGYCTPGMLMTLTPLVEAGKPLTHDEVREEIGGNLCRCTGYEALVDAMVEVTAK